VSGQTGATPATRYDHRTVVEGTPEFLSLQRLERAVADLALAVNPAQARTPRDAFLDAQREFCHLLRSRSKPAVGVPDPRWLITDLITLGSPLTHAEFLLARDVRDLRARQEDREFPVSPPIREVLDPDVALKAKAAGFQLDPKSPQLLCFPFGSLHHAAPFAAVRWTNIHDLHCS
jgi:hypothetical protein